VRIKAHAPAKLVLMGEYAVLEGAPAIVAAVDRLVHVTITPAASGADGRWTVRTDLGGGQAATLAFDEARALVPGIAWLHPVEVVLERATRALGMRAGDLPGGEITIESASLFVDAGETKLGLGSSAAVITALSAALQDALVHWDLAARTQPSLQDDLAAHRHLQQGRGSGVDIAASLVGGVLRYQLVDGRPQVAPLALPPGIVFGVVWTGVAASTAACEAGDGAAFLATVRGYHEAMDDLGRRADLSIVSPAHRTIAGLAETEGVAYKPSGAGGGDVGLLFAASQPALVQAGRLAQRAGYRLLDLGVHPAGGSGGRHERTAS